MEQMREQLLERKTRASLERWRKHFRVRREITELLTREGTVTENLIREVDRASDDLIRKDCAMALQRLAELRRIIELYRARLDIDKQENDQVDQVMVLRKEVAELKRDNALLRDDREEADAQQSILKATIETYFTAASEFLDIPI